MQLLRKVPPLVVAVALVLLVTACSKGPGESPPSLPSWSPPSWMHGSWTATGVMESVTMEATAHNLVIEIDFGEAPFRFDLKQKSASGATILHHRYIMNGQRNYSVSIAEGEARDEFDCAEVDATTMDCFWTHITRTDETTIGPFRLTRL